jgi:hypothetical protein
MGDSIDKLGGGPGAVVGANLLREIESCPDPAHFESKIQASKTEAEWKSYFKKLEEERAKRPPRAMKELQDALDLYHEMERGLRRRGAKRKAGGAQPRSKARRRARKRVEPQSRRHKAKAPRPVAAVYDRRKNPEEAPGSAGASPCPENSGAHSAPPQEDVLLSHSSHASLGSLSSLPNSVEASPGQSSAPALPGGTDGVIKPNQG